MSKRFLRAALVLSLYRFESKQKPGQLIGD